jgi:hypothetical protein
MSFSVNPKKILVTIEFTWACLMAATGMEVIGALGTGGGGLPGGGGGGGTASAEGGGAAAGAGASSLAGAAASGAGAAAFLLTAPISNNQHSNIIYVINIELILCKCLLLPRIIYRRIENSPPERESLASCF